MSETMWVKHGGDYNIYYFSYHRRPLSGAYTACRPVGREQPFFFCRPDLTLSMRRKFWEMLKISYGPTTSQKAGSSLDCSLISAAIKLTSECIKGVMQKR